MNCEDVTVEAEKGWTMIAFQQTKNDVYLWYGKWMWVDPDECNTIPSKLHAVIEISK